ncbi:MBL fold metallo-hydrolase [Selenomonas noxia]|uniref:MBL fold metallo-hydrolase n=1 Tax=Selenomonas noxia TaxID=135083 RepID=UPI00288B3AA4|nr:MBL fold metallo-hydrolase [Selenomonas noxia]
MQRRNFIFSMLAGIGALAGGVGLFVRQEKFGRAPSGARLERIKASPHYVDGQFVCLEPVDAMMDDLPEEEKPNRLETLYRVLFGGDDGRVPKEAIPSNKTDLHAIPREQDVAVWMGHSTFYLQVGGRRILVDPVFSAYGSPIFFINRAFRGSNVYTAADIPTLDVLLMTHDHWDHLDYDTVMALKPKVKEIICPLGVGEFFEQWGFDLGTLHEEDWDTDIALTDDFHIHILPSQHFSGRFLTRNNTQWCGFAVITPERRIYISGDGGYGKHFKDIGARFDGFDLAMMENGQYNMQWHAIHMLPNETAQAAEDVRARFVLPAHSGKFALALHTWQEPYAELLKESAGRPYRMVTPRIGETVDMEQPADFPRWWEGMA